MGRANCHVALAILLHVAAISLGCRAATGQPIRPTVTSGPPVSVEFRDVVTQPLPPEFQGRLYQTQPLPGDRPAVLATTGQFIVVVSDKVDVPRSVTRQGAIGETVVLPSPLSLRPLPEIRVGVLVHNHHAIDRFRLVDIAGRTLMTLEDRRHFHYRVAPDGNTFVGLDNGGIHTGLTAPEVIYRFFSAQGAVIAEVKSVAPQSPDSEYGPDAQSFLISSRAGLSAHDPTTGRRLWMIDKEVKFFAASNRQPGRVLVTDAKNRQIAELYEGGRRLWQLNVADSGATDAVRNVAIAPNGAFGAVSSGTVVLIMSATDAKPRGVLNLGEAFRISSLSVRDDGLVAVGVQAAGARDKEQSTGRIIVIDRSGNLLLQRETAHQRNNAWMPAVRFSANGHSLLVETLESIGVLSVR